MANYIYEYVVYAKRRYVAKFFISDTPEFVNNVKKRLAIAQYTLKMSTTDFMRYLLISGLELIESLIQKGEKGKIPERGAPEHQDFAVAHKIKEIYGKMATGNQLEFLYEAMGAEQFIEWCKTENVEYEEFMAEFTWMSQTKTQSEKDKDWLKTYLEGSGDSPCSEIRKFAFESQYVSSETEWNRVEQAGRRMGLHHNDQRRGYWALKNTKRQKDNTH